jgi:hypothetical protein
MGLPKATLSQLKSMSLIDTLHPISLLILTILITYYVILIVFRRGIVNISGFNVTLIKFD